MKRDYYELPKSSAIMRFLWKCAGGDRYLLERATYSDQIKYMCLGGIVFATGAMAGIAGGYAYYTIFEPRSSAIENPVDIGVAITAMVFGLIWGLMIFNIDRFIVTSTGKGDGTEEITWLEFKGAIPRILMGAIIAITISKPVEIRMFKTEIDIKLREKQIEQQTAYQTKVDKTFGDREKLLEVEFSTVEKKRTEHINNIKKYDDLYAEEMTQGQGGRGKGEGPVAKSLKEQREKYERLLANFDNENKEDIELLKKRKETLRTEKETELKNNQKIANGLDGLLERIKIAHEVAGFWITLFITLLFMAIELTPVFFKLMLIKSPYDYLAENRDELIKAEKGIEIQYDFYTDKDGMERHLVINHEAHRMIYEKKKITEIQKELTDYAAEKYLEREKKKIDENPDDFITPI